MNKKLRIKNKLNILSSDNIIKPSKIIPRICLLGNVLYHTSEDYTHFLIKFRYYKKLQLSLNDDEDALKFYPKMKFLREFEIKNWSRAIESFPEMHRLYRTKIDLDWVDSNTLFQILLKDLKYLRLLNLVSLKIKIRLFETLTLYYRDLILTILMKNLSCLSNLKVFCLRIEKMKMLVLKFWTLGKFLPNLKGSRK